MHFCNFSVEPIRFTNKNTRLASSTGIRSRGYVRKYSSQASVMKRLPYKS